MGHVPGRCVVAAIERRLPAVVLAVTLVVATVVAVTAGVAPAAEGEADRRGSEVADVLLAALADADGGPSPETLEGRLEGGVEHVEDWHVDGRRVEVVLDVSDAVWAPGLSGVRCRSVTFAEDGSGATVSDGCMRLR
jgi:hypothetical protein